jgi:hypothetical protein
VNPIGRRGNIVLFLDIYSRVLKLEEVVKHYTFESFQFQTVLSPTEFESATNKLARECKIENSLRWG